MLTFAKQLRMWLLVRNGGDEGATAVEYGLIVALIAGAIVVILTTLGGSLESLFTSTNTRVSTSDMGTGLTAG